MSDIADTLNLYLAKYPEERDSLTLLLSQLTTGEELTKRKNFTGHVTGSGLVLSLDRSKVLLIFHRIRGRWQQPGGHMDPGELNPLESARREVQEETGLTDFVLLGAEVPVHVDTHFIPANPKKQEPEHWHHDFQYAFIAQNEHLHVDDDGVMAAEWVSLDDPRVLAEPWIAQAIQRLG